MAQPQTPAAQLPTKDGLEAQLTQLIVQRSQLKDQIEAVEKQLPVVSSMLQLLVAQEEIAEANKAEVTQD